MWRERMELLLCEDVEHLGYLGDIVEVKTGYARNYLIPQGLAIPPTKANIRSLADEKAQRAEQRRLVRRQLEALVEKVNGAEAVLAAKANEHGVLFGSITDRMIAANLREQGFAVADEVVKLGGHIKQVGTHSVTLRFADDVTATVNVVVVAEEAEEETEEEE